VAASNPDPGRGDLRLADQRCRFRKFQIGLEQEVFLSIKLWDSFRQSQRTPFDDLSDDIFDPTSVGIGDRYREKLTL
jgi:hypothetical protein